MINTKHNGLPQMVVAFQTGSQKYRALAAGCVVLFGMMVEAKAVLLTTGLPVATSPTVVVQPGTVVGTLSANYGPSIGGQDMFFGTLDSIVVKRSAASVIDGQVFNAGGLDFWVQDRMDFTLPPPQSNPGADNSRLTYSPFNVSGGPGNFISAEFLIGASVPAGVPGFSGMANGTQGPQTVQSGGGVIQWDWTSPLLDNSMNILNPNSRWLVLHTNETIFGQVPAGVIDGGIAATQTFAPVPEPATALFGIAITGMLGLARRRTRAIAS
jgi:hypothetical protein